MSEISKTLGLTLELTSNTMTWTSMDGKFWQASPAGVAALTPGTVAVATNGCEFGVIYEAQDPVVDGQAKLEIYLALGKGASAYTGLSFAGVSLGVLDGSARIDRNVSLAFMNSVHAEIVGLGVTASGGKTLAGGPYVRLSIEPSTVPGVPGPAEMGKYQILVHLKA
jgi:hypothetical protein